jgi:AcrR family transcriptional regulator/DNA-binding XRE family transcriptional regulator
MARQVKKPEIRKTEILEAAQKYFFQKGYEQTSIQDIIDELGIAKGTFYHYFRSKEHLLDELTELMTSQMAAKLKPIAETDENALEKFNQIFAQGVSFKVTNIDLFIILLNTLYTDENTIIREKMFRRAAEKYKTIFSAIVKQGNEEGVFNASYPDEISDVIMQVGKILNETICRLFLNRNLNAEQLIAHTRNKIELFQDALERILGASKNSIRLIDPGEFNETVKLFYNKLQPKEDV